MNATTRSIYLTILTLAFTTLVYPAANVNEFLVNKTIHVATNGSDANGGTSPGDAYKTLDKALDSATNHIAQGIGGAKIYIHEGTYRVTSREIDGTSVDTSYPLVIEGESYGNVIITGAERWVLWGYSASENVYYQTWEKDWGVDDVPDWPYDGILEDYMPEISRRREVVTVNNTMLTQVPASNNLSSSASYGSYYVDETADKIFVKPPTGTDMINDLVEVGVNPGILSWSTYGLLKFKGWHNLVFRNLVFSHACTKYGALNFPGVTNVLIDSCIFRNNNITGVSLWDLDGVESAYFTYTNVLAEDNGWMGFSVPSHSLVIRATVRRNNWRGLLGGRFGGVDAGTGTKTDAAGIKVGNSDDLHFIDCDIYSNASHGLWLDVAIRRAWIDNCRIFDNLGGVTGANVSENPAGIFWEISAGACYISNTTIYGNARGIRILSASNVHIFNSVISNNTNTQVEINVNSRSMGTGYEDIWPDNYARTGVVTVVSNVIYSADASQTLISISMSLDEDIFFTHSLINSNRYYCPATENVFANGVDFAQWKEMWPIDDDSVFGNSGTIGVVLTAPTNRQIYDASPQTFTADAWGAVDTVLFYTNGVLIGSDTSAPYSLSVPLDVEGGFHAYAVATNTTTGAFAKSAQFFERDPQHVIALHLPFDEAGALGSNAGVAADASPSGTVTYEAAGKVGGAGRFAGGGSDYLGVPDESAIRFQKFTMAVWVKPDVSFGNMTHSFPRVFSKWSQAGSTGYKFGMFDSSQDQVAIAFFTNTSLNTAVIMPYAGSNEWIHIAAVHDKKSVAFYSNGICYTNIELATSDHAIQYDSISLTIGPGFDGLMDEAYIYNYALPESEVMNIYLSGIIDTNAPSTVSLLLPANAIITNVARPTFSWNATTDDLSGVAHYLLRISNTQGGASTVHDRGTLLSYTPTSDLADGTYAWSVAAVDGKSNTNTYATERSITIDTTASAPVPLSPTNATSLSTSRPTFVFEGVTDASGIAGYVLSFSNTATAFTYEVSTGTNTNYTLPFLYALSNGTHAWRVAAIDTIGNRSAWSSARLVTTTERVWQTYDVGNVSVAGTYVREAGAGTFVHALTASGAGFTYYQDEVFFMYNALVGDGEISLRVDSITNGADAFGGILIRPTLAFDAPFFFVGVDGESSGMVASRDAEGSVADVVAATAYTWFRVTRVGNTLTGYGANDGTNWSAITTMDITDWTNEVLIGPSASSGNDGTIATARFSFLSVDGDVRLSSHTNADVTTNVHTNTPPAVLGATKGAALVSEGGTITFGSYTGNAGYQDITIAIHNIAGQPICVLTSLTTAGSITWDGKDDYGRVVPSGTYIYRITVIEGNTTTTKTGVVVIVH